MDQCRVSIVMVRIIFLVVAIISPIYGDDHNPFYDLELCSLGCGFDWDLTIGKHEEVGQKDHELSEEDTDYKKSILISPGESITYTLSREDDSRIPFRGFELIGGSYNGAYDCTLPKTIEVYVNDKLIDTVRPKRVRDRQFLGIADTDVKNGDKIRCTFIDGFVIDKAIGITLLVPEGGH